MPYDLNGSDDDDCDDESAPSTSAPPPLPPSPPHVPTAPLDVLPPNAGVGSRVAIDWGTAGGWREGYIAELQHQLAYSGGARHIFRVVYDEVLPRGGCSTWHGDEFHGTKGVRLLSASEEEDRADVVGTWAAVHLRCNVSMLPLTEPARGSGCAHPPQVNRSVLCSFVGGPCPLACCSAHIRTTRDVVLECVLPTHRRCIPH